MKKVIYKEQCKSQWKRWFAMHNKNHDGQCEILFFVIIEMGKMWSGRALQKSLLICNTCGYKAKLVLGFLRHVSYP